MNTIVHMDVTPNSDPIIPYNSQAKGPTKTISVKSLVTRKRENFTERYMLCILYYDDIPNTHVSYKQLQTIGGHMKNIKQKSENAKLTISRLDGVRRFFVHVNMYTTSPLPMTASTPKKKIVTPNHLYHSDSIGGN